MNHAWQANGEISRGAEGALSWEHAGMMEEAGHDLLFPLSKSGFEALLCGAAGMLRTPLRAFPP